VALDDIRLEVELGSELRPSGNGDWRYVFDLDGATSLITVKNQVRADYPAPYATLSSGQDTPIGPEKTTPTPK
jgi:hypothetical protein